MKLPLVLTISLLSFGCSRENPETATKFKNKKDCAERAEAYLRRERTIDTPSNGINGSVRNEQYTYSNSLNTCLLYFEVARSWCRHIVQHCRYANEQEHLLSH